ncbi:hypothetical protein [Streptomyces lydicamycinicus]|uniref:hypothetical protein n=1 Tax=Streptomyces lydicamycinicus TaxID=1546107 RepID=UPI000AA2C2ED|nr:hypothetical protein [Streptomyces lydicamycinicus]
MSVDQSEAVKRSKLGRFALVPSGLAVFGTIACATGRDGWRNPGVIALVLTFALSAAIAILAWRKGRLRLAVLALAVMCAPKLVELALRPWWPPF